MKTLTLSLLIAAVLPLACDEHKYDKITATDASPAASASALASALAAVVASAPPPAPSFTKKLAVDCKPNPKTLDFSGTDGAALEAEIRRKLAKPDGEIKPGDLANVKSLNLSITHQQLHQVDPCIFPLFTSATGLFLGPGDYDDLSPIAKLTNVNDLNVSLSRVKDLHPIEGLKRMDRLDLSHTSITDDDLKSIAGLTNVEELWLNEDNISDLKPVAGMTKLTALYIKNTLVKDLTPIAGLHTLKKLYIGGSAVSDISPVQPLVSSGMKLFQN
jgi:internalin A